MNTRDKLVHAVTAFDRAQEAKATKNPRHYYNHYALPQYLGAVARVADDIEAGAAVDEAIIAAMHGPLRTACLKACGFKANHVPARHGNYLGLPVYRPASQK